MKRKAKTAPKSAKKSKSTPKKKTARTKAKTKKKAAPKKKPAAKKKVAKKKPAAAKKAAPKKKATAKKKAAPKKKAAAKKNATPRKKSVPAARKPIAKKAAKPKKPRRPRLKPMPTEELNRFKDVLLALRDRLTGQISVLKNESLRRPDSVISEEDGTDAFERQFALALASSENESVFEIDEALRRIATAIYGICEECGHRIGKERLEARPSARLCIGCKSLQEKGKVRHNTMDLLRAR